MIIFLIFLNFFWFGCFFFFLATTPFRMMGNSSMLFTFLLSLDWRLIWWQSFGGHFFLFLWSLLYYACLAAHNFFFSSFLDLSFVGDNNFFNIVCGRFCHCLTPPSSSSRFLFLLLVVAVCACGVVVEVALSLLLLSFK